MVALPHYRLRRFQRWLVSSLVLGNLATVVIPSVVRAELLKLHNQAESRYDGVATPAQGSPDPIVPLTSKSRTLGETITRRNLVDPLGRIVGCAGEVLSNYNGFSVGLYEPSSGDPTGATLGNLLSMTLTEVPDLPTNTIPAGLEPNSTNQNPFLLEGSNKGVYNFLLDTAKGQLNEGRQYILVVQPPRDSRYSERRIKITIGQRQGNMVSYVATSLDGQPISTDSNNSSVSGQIPIQDAAQTALVLAALNLKTSVCQAQALEIVKTGDRAAAAPGDVVIYRLAIRNLATAAIQRLRITDTLPLGIRFREGSVFAEFKGQKLAVAARAEGTTVVFDLDPFQLPASQGSGRPDSLTLVYAAVVTPDAVRGSGKNRALVSGQRTDNQRQVSDGPSIYALKIRPGIVSDCGTLLGRVFVDKNFDGEQQPGEPGVPNAVIFMDDGNRIVTDANGLFSVANMLPGYRTGVLDLSSIPGYTLAPNLYFIERNSQSRLVHMEPSGLARMNFAVTPTFREDGVAPPKPVK